MRSEDAASAPHADAALIAASPRARVLRSGGPVGCEEGVTRWATGESGSASSSSRWAIPALCRHRRGGRARHRHRRSDPHGGGCGAVPSLALLRRLGTLDPRKVGPRHRYRLRATRLRSRRPSIEGVSVHDGRPEHEAVRDERQDRPDRGRHRSRGSSRRARRARSPQRDRGPRVCGRARRPRPRAEERPHAAETQPQVVRFAHASSPSSSTWRSVSAASPQMAFIVPATSR